MDLILVALRRAIRSVRMWRLNRACRFIERFGLAVVKVRKTEGAVYLVGRSGEYVRYDKVAKTPNATTLKAMREAMAIKRRA